MSDAITVKVTFAKTPNGVIVKPVTNADATVFNNFVNSTVQKYLTLNIKSTNANKSYKQIKTAWALISIIFESIYFRKPSKSELEQIHDELIKDYSDTKPSLLHPGEFVPVTLREMSKQEMSKFIQSLVNELATSCELTNKEQISAQEVFCEWENYLSSLKEDPTDLDEAGNFLPISEWREKHLVSFASGKTATDEMQLDLAHIVSRGSDEAHRDCCWNVMMLTHEEHMKQHEIGWDDFLELYPHLRGRVERARKMAGKLALRSTLKREEEQVVKSDSLLENFL